MTPIEGSLIFAQLVAHICNWKGQRNATSTDQFQDFVKWLITHKFENLRERA